jgi:hypothetical protein
LNWIVSPVGDLDRGELIFTLASRINYEDLVLVALIETRRGVPSGSTKLIRCTVIWSNVALRGVANSQITVITKTSVRKPE